MLTTVYSFKIMWKDGSVAERCVVADTEEEAIKKIEMYRSYVATHEGVMDFEILGYPTVELDYVIR